MNIKFSPENLKGTDHSVDSVDKIKFHILCIFCYIHVDSIEMIQAETNGKLQPTTGSFTSL
jgi:hypothetical protein